MESARMRREMVDCGGLRVFCRDTRTSGEAILCLHGRWGRGETWADFVRRYEARYRVIAPDLRGHGLSDKPLARYTAEEMAADMVALLDSLGIGRAIVVGHSMGGHVAGWLAARRPDRVRAVAILDKSSAGPARGSPLPPEDIPPVDPLTKDWPLPFPSLREAKEFIRGATDSELSYRYFMNSLVEGVEGYRMMFSAQAVAANMAYYEDWSGLLPDIGCPALILRSGSHEAVPDADFERMRSLLPDCLALEVSGADHNVHLSDPEEFYACFDRFLARVEGAGPRRR